MPISNDKNKVGAILSVELRTAGVQCMPTLAVPHVVSSKLIKPFKIVDCIARQGTERALQSHCKPRGNPRAADWISCFSHKLLPYAPSSPTSPCFTPLSLWRWHNSMPFSFVLSENPTAVTHAPFSSPFSVAAFLCYPSSDPTFVLFSSTQKLLKARVQRKSQRRKATQGYAFAGLSPVFSSYQDLFYNVSVLQQHNPFLSLLNKPSQRS